MKKMRSQSQELNSAKVPSYMYYLPAWHILCINVRICSIENDRPGTSPWLDLGHRVRQ